MGIEMQRCTTTLLVAGLLLFAVPLAIGEEPLREVDTRDGARVSRFGRLPIRNLDGGVMARRPASRIASWPLLRLSTPEEEGMDAGVRLSEGPIG